MCADSACPRPSDSHGAAGARRIHRTISSARRCTPNLLNKVGNMELYRTLGDEELGGDLLVGKILQQQIQDLALAAADGDVGIERLAAVQLGQDRIKKAGQNLAWDPVSAAGEFDGRTRQFALRLGIGQHAFHS